MRVVTFIFITAILLSQSLNAFGCQVLSIDSYRTMFDISNEMDEFIVADVSCEDSCEIGSVGQVQWKSVSDQRTGTFEARIVADYRSIYPDKRIILDPFLYWARAESGCQMIPTLKVGADERFIIGKKGDVVAWSTPYSSNGIDSVFNIIIGGERSFRPVFESVVYEGGNLTLRGRGVKKEWSWKGVTEWYALKEEVKNIWKQSESARLRVNIEIGDEQSFVLFFPLDKDESFQDSTNSRLMRKMIFGK